ncbi:Hydroxymethylpyrimidine ABC transporter, ATPase component [Candidatus Rhodobacter oscarellae]|uniref:Hydroxymethylpyrimidine ABC transporter, ATPase component n=1 Tax=Candidatus Rhodobacter oscarellae TaxID=1675527 RepID=A0A0J9ECM2_9RHOB|nr:ABC transporter ATP-binding protein [Candidatus Rhodobacter lobularis]KMW59469.1 Hydroxymethylpyrimidine ABC transporter, ATPase component [Candidatus Rhodobacter lobularis]
MSQAPGITVKGRAEIGGARLFAPLTLELAPGAWTCLLGGSGVGKSTILRLVAGLETEAAFTGDISASDGGPVAPRVGYMAQDDLLLPWASVAQNIALGPRLRGDPTERDRLAGLMARVGLNEHAQKRPYALSGGQRQRVALARTLMEDKPVILLDEPFSALDARTRAEMQDLAVELLAGRTVLVVTHDPGEAARLGHSVQVMTPEGLTEVTPPKAAIPRGVDAQETLACQADLMRHLMALAA